MSIPLLLGRQHSVYDDVSHSIELSWVLQWTSYFQLQSLFFVCYLSLFTFGDPLPNCFPNRPPPLNYCWPRACRKWANPTDDDTEDSGLFKQHYFMGNHRAWERLTYHARSLWTTSDSTSPTQTSLSSVHLELLRTFHNQLWIMAHPQACYLMDNQAVTPLSIITALQGDEG